MNKLEQPGKLRLGVNIDHVATVRNARGSRYPDPLRAAKLAEEAGADGITAHLREDRRHISDEDIEALMEGLSVNLNLEIAATPQMQEIALRHVPHAVCVVPERREEKTTESGLDVAGQLARVARFVDPLATAGSRVSLFVDPDARQIQAASDAGAAVVEMHTGSYADAYYERRSEDLGRELERLREAAACAAGLGLEVHAGHGLTFDTVGAVAEIPEVVELNIGHFLVGEAIFAGLAAAIAEMRRLMEDARAG